jgi:hypothetical protein
MMATRPTTDRTTPTDMSHARASRVFGREWWGLDRDRLEDELARREQTRAGEPVPH